MSANSYIIEIVGLNKFYDGLPVLKNINFKIKSGETVGILGANGAGKSTLLESIEGLRKIDNGNIKVLGLDIKKHQKKIQKNIGIQLQKTSLFEELTVEDNVKIFYGLYGVKKNIIDIINEFDLEKIKNSKVGRLSGGQFQRLNLCLSMINNPKILFLDEPTTGLDPKVRKELWDKIRELKNAGHTILLTTHYMEEAEELCDRIIFMRQGKIVADDTPKNLTKTINIPKELVIEVDKPITREEMHGLDSIANGTQIRIKSSNIMKDLMFVFEIFKNKDIQVIDVKITDANLEDVYMEIYNATTSIC
ncbi:ABC transporter ATP-binding protein [Maribacter sp. M208]|uniref:ABC transporter ATP-binding protein n=1 Tax=Maribacter huludaoensis TaxID=3030010 RepID=UPI0023EB0D59|nr:ABC transporter ATP-binding protein [Maribacter huludaoensis]MDF4221064.1 ABC transporter ATP-binding protein [Maribacter huludaoensis]